MVRRTVRYSAQGNGSRRIGEDEHGKYEKDYDPHTPPMELKKEIRMEDVSYTYH